MDVQLRLIDSFVDLHDSHLGEVDLVLRASPLADTRLVATPLAYMVRIACASPTYLASHGVPPCPSELPEHHGLDWDGLPPPESSGIYALRLEHETNSRSRLLLEFLKSRFSPVPPWDLALRSGLRR